MSASPESTPVDRKWLNGLDWAVVVGCGLLLAWMVFHIGAILPETMLQVSWGLAGLLVLHAAWLFMGGGARGLSHAALLFVPFLLWVGYQAYNSPTQWLGLRDVLLWAQGLIFFWLISQHARTRRRLWVLFGILGAIMVMLTLFAIYQYKHEGWLPMGREQTRYIMGRMSSTFGNPNHMSAFILLMIFPLWMLGISNRFGMSIRVAAIWAGCVFAILIIPSYSRGALISMLIALLFIPLFVFRRWKTRLIIWGAVAAIGCASFYYLYNEVDMFRFRMDEAIANKGESTRHELWKVGWEMFQEEPAVGIGTGYFNTSFQQRQGEGFVINPLWTHNDYLQILAENGVVGFLLFMAPCLFVLGKSIRYYYKPPRAEGAWRGEHTTGTTLVSGILLGVMAFSIHTIVDFHLRIPALLFAVALWFGVLVQITVRPAAPKAWMRFAGGGVALAGAIALIVYALPFYRAETIYYAIDDRNFGKGKGVDFYQEWIGYADEALQNAPYHADLYAMKSWLHMRAYRLGERKDDSQLDHAMRATQGGLAIYPHHFDALRYTAYVHTYRSEFADAEVNYRALLEYYPNKATGWFYYAHLLNQMKGREKDALKAVNRSLELHPYVKGPSDLKRKIEGKLQ